MRRLFVFGVGLLLLARFSWVAVGSSATIVVNGADLVQGQSVAVDAALLDQAEMVQDRVIVNGSQYLYRHKLVGGSTALQVVLGQVPDRLVFNAAQYQQKHLLVYPTGFIDETPPGHYLPVVSK